MFAKDTLILSVDDMDSARALLKSHLEGLGYTNVLDASDGQQALGILKEMYDLGSPVGLVISDWVMAGMSGLDFLIKLRATEGISTLPFLMVTAEEQATQVVKAVQAGVTDYIVKPFNSAVLFKKLTNVWNKTQGRR